MFEYKPRIKPAITRTNMDTLPIEMLMKIFLFCEEEDRYRLMCVNKKFFSILVNRKECEKFIVYAAEHDHINFLKYAIRQGCDKFLNEHDWEIMFYIASGGHNKCLKYLLKKKCIFDFEALRGATEYGKVKCLKRMIKANVLGHGKHSGSKFKLHIGKSMLQELYWHAAVNGQLKVLKYLDAVDERCWNSEAVRDAKKYGRLNCVEYFEKL